MHQFIEETLVKMRAFAKQQTISPQEQHSCRLNWFLDLHFMVWGISPLQSGLDFFIRFLIHIAPHLSRFEGRVTLFCSASSVPGYLPFHIGFRFSI
jgi:hypothetical protein